MKTTINDFYPNKGQFLENDPIEFVIEYTSNENHRVMGLIIKVYHLDKLVFEIEDVKASNESIKVGTITLPSLPIGGYGAELIVYDNEQIIQTITTAFDVGSSYKELPRYGFLSDFATEDELDESDVLSMKKLHINMVQFYDWMYRHESLVSDVNHYTDLMGKVMTKKAITNKIELCHKNGMSTMAYGAIYAASEEFYKKHLSWGLNDSIGKPFTFIDIFHIMNIAESSPWHQHIIDEYKKTISQFGFDGIHMDTYGFPKTGYSNYATSTELIKMDQAFPVLINNTKEQLCEIKEDVNIIFNNVGNWPVYATAPTDQDMIYVEVWEPYNTYAHIQRIIHEARALCDKPIIISAYLKPFMTSNQIEAGNALKLMTACVVSNGANHLIMGENQAVLTQGYYVDNFPIEDILFGEIRKYYDFMIRYCELFYDKRLIDVSMTHAYGDNLEYVFSGAPCSPSGERDKIWTIIREDSTTKLVSLINLCGNNEYWNESKTEPSNIGELTIDIQVENEVDEVWMTSPELQSLQNIPYQITNGSRGQRLSVVIEELDLWTVLIIKSH